MSKALTAELTAPNGRKYTQPLGLFINNERVIAAVYTATEEDVDDAVNAARAALDGPWQELSGTERGALLQKLADLIDAEKETLATVETWHNGKPYQTALTEDVIECSNTIRYYAGWADKIHGQGKKQSRILCMCIQMVAHLTQSSQQKNRSLSTLFENLSVSAA
ncbi:mitochondrial aldehyde dehydrogenase [Exophiala xenobiotica]|nr:mitochondrial aldehyde dehydrogenase [Exophiala xenobiotica]KAK5262761.1 mitochondrial aldehyde dehydrogenase [Exophiala xenobiotica]KAK5282024.1 mitochondrial aldehyde dehydrogenase [Exophiala xenobiotica]KAK5332128.1 mitochondrial aldehyde dehydrogenase [Exophiala xenobiotica]KAK5456823.1 mitochondrial aldehyde dehydrogenase [Exophiala xenobiotica]